jgi:hypothetical protein
MRKPLESDRDECDRHVASLTAASRRPSTGIYEHALAQRVSLGSDRFRASLLRRSVLGSACQHGVQDIAAASSKADECGAVILAFGSLAVIVGPGDRVFQSRER